MIVGGSDGYNTHNDDYDRWATGALSYYENVGSATTPVFKEIQEGSPVERLDIAGHVEWSDDDEVSVRVEPSPTLVDLDADGDLDLLVGVIDGKLYYFENKGTATSPQFVEYALGHDRRVDTADGRVHAHHR